MIYSKVLDIKAEELESHPIFRKMTDSLVLCGTTYLYNDVGSLLAIVPTEDIEAWKKKQGTTP